MLSFSKAAACITHNATWPHSDFIKDNLSDYMQLPLKSQKATTLPLPLKLPMLLKSTKLDLVFVKNHTDDIRLC